MRIIPKKLGLSDTNIGYYKPVPSAEKLRQEIPLDGGEETVLRTREQIKAILDGRDSRRIMNAGPCSVHDIDEAKFVLDETKPVVDEVKSSFLVIVRLCYEKPRTGPSWPGYVTDPQMNGSGGLEKGLRDIRTLLVYAAKLGIGTSAEFVTTADIPHYTSDLLSYGWIGARTSESQEHHEHASRSSVPVGIKNGLSGKLENTAYAVLKSTYPQVSLGRMRNDQLAEVGSEGNPYAHLILRGSDQGPNYDVEHVALAERFLDDRNLRRSLIVDCSHANSGKDNTRQPAVCLNVVEQMRTNPTIKGAMLEVYINEGAQKLPDDRTGFDRRTLRSGLSVTDACMSLQTFKELMKETYRMVN